MSILAQERHQDKTANESNQIAMAIAEVNGFVASLGCVLGRRSKATDRPFYSASREVILSRIVLYKGDLPCFQI